MVSVSSFAPQLVILPPKHVYISAKNVRVYRHNAAVNSNATGLMRCQCRYRTAIPYTVLTGVRDLSTLSHTAASPSFCEVSKI